jgi:protein subunit release factor A
MKPHHSSLIIEVRAAEGGDDAKALVVQQVAIYIRLASRRSL